MNFASKFTTEFIKAEINKNPQVLDEEKALENKKMVLSNDAFAVGSELEKLRFALAEMK